MKYTDEWSEIEGSIARMVVKRNCNLAKVINSRCRNTHQNKVSIKWSTTQVKNKPERDAKQDFMIGEVKW